MRYFGQHTNGSSSGLSVGLEITPRRTDSSAEKTLATRAILVVEFLTEEVKMIEDGVENYARNIQPNPYPFMLLIFLPCQGGESLSYAIFGTHPYMAQWKGVAARQCLC